MMGKISAALLRLFGWSITGDPPVHLAKAVIIVMPHTSNWDFPLGLLVRAALGVKVQFIGKHTLFRPPFGWLFRALGGHPVDRSRPNSLVEQTIELFRAHDEFLLAIAPEGTRKKVERIKTGFYHIAEGAGVPIVMVRFDYGRRRVHFSNPFFPTGHKAADMARILDFFRGVAGRHAGLGIDEHTAF